MINVDDILNALERVLKDEMDFYDLTEIMESIPKDDKYAFIKEALHQAYHYISDQDIRMRDKDYENELKKNILRYIEELSG
jgi:hypothetical protein